MPSRKNRNPISRFTDVCLTGASWASVLGLWAVAASVYVSPADFRIAGIMGLAFPMLLAGTVFCLVLCLLFAPRRCWITLLGLLLCAGSIRSYCPFNFTTDDDATPAANSEARQTGTALTVMTYNCHGFPGVTTDEPKREILEYIDSQDADLFVYQEGNNSVPKWLDLCPAFKKRYPYHEEPYDGKTTRQGIYSRYPIERTELITSSNLNAVVAFWLKLPKGDSLLVVNCHLRTNSLTPEDRTQYSRMVKAPIDAAKGGKNNPEAENAKPLTDPDSTLLTSRHLASKIATASAIRAEMIDTVADFLSRHANIRTIVCGDFNDTPIAYSTYRMKRLGLNDAYRMAGNGMGRSFNKDAIAVRIDHQFCSDHYKPVSARIDRTPQWSDHYPLIVKYKGPPSNSPR